LLNIGPNPPCCGSGAYEITVHGKELCKQAILRTNENGSGLPVLILAGILFFILLRVYGDELGFGKDNTWLPIIIALILSALITNQRITKNNLVIIGGWIAVFVIGSKISKSMSKDDPSGAKGGFAFGLAYAFVSLAANMLGTTLFGGEITYSEISSGMIIKNIGLGVLFGFVYSSFKGQGIIGKILKSRKEKTEKDIDKLVEQGKVIEPFLRSLPIIGGRWAPKDAAAKAKKDINDLVDDLEEIKTLKPKTTNPALISEIDKKIKKIENKIINVLKKSP
jgi:hypothetical protein